jgi:hypothetical protein
MSMHCNVAYRRRTAITMGFKNDDKSSPGDIQQLSIRNCQVCYKGPYWNIFTCETTIPLKTHHPLSKT